jgi:hypothetical protein
MTRKKQIEQIIARRRPLADALKGVVDGFMTVGMELDRLKQLREQLLQQVGDECIKGKLRNLELDALGQRLGDQIQAVARLHARFARETLNIGVIGRAGQGKSCLLQSLSGLGDTEIPSGRLGHCTGVRSTICHNPDVTPHAEIRFYAESEFLRTVLKPYYDPTELDLGPSPLTLEEFAGNPLPPLPPSRADQEEARQKHQHLQNYKEHLPTYRTWLGRALPDVELAKVRTFVAQDDPAGERIFHNYLAVSDARIVCSFPQDDLGRVALVDMPGLGDTGVGAEARLIQTLGREVDAILFLKRPSEMRSAWEEVDVRLYDLAHSALPELPLQRWAFLVLNRVRSDDPKRDNLINCKHLVEETINRSVAFADRMIADCTDPTEAAELVLRRVLDHLATHIERMDRDYAAACMAQAQQLQQRTDTEMRRASGLLGSGDGAGDEMEAFNRLFHETHGTLKERLGALILTLAEQRNLPDDDFLAQIEAVRQCSYRENGVPAREEIERKALGSSYPEAYIEGLHSVRTHLTRQFQNLDSGLSSSMDAVKSQAAHVLSGDGRLGGLSTSEGGRFFSELAALLPADSAVLRPAFEMYAGFQLSYRGFLYYRVRKHVDCLMPNLRQGDLSPRPTAAEVEETLTAMHQMAMEELRSEFNAWPAEINMVAYAVTEELVDRLLRSPKVDSEWWAFYKENRTQIWPEQFRTLAATSRLNRLWREATERVRCASENVALLPAQ